MKKLFILLFAVAFVFALSGCANENKDATEDVHTILSDIAAEEIVTASFDSHIPNYIYEIDDLTIVNELLKTLDGATFESCAEPKEPLSSIEAILINTAEHKYYLGVIDNSAFKISVDGEGKYYTCNQKDTFLNKLLELQEQGIKNIPALTSISDLSEEQLAKQLVGVSQEKLKIAWGEPNGKGSGFWMDYWHLDDVNTISIYYDADGKVETIKITDELQ